MGFSLGWHCTLPPNLQGSVVVVLYNQFRYRLSTQVYKKIEMSKIHVMG